MAKFLTMPDQTRTSMPGGVPYIVGNEAAERFSFYGMKAILVVFMTQYLMSAGRDASFLNEAEAREAMSWFVASAYFFPVIGAIIADAILGKYLVIMILSWVYVLGHACLAMMDLPGPMLEATMEPKGWLMAGLFLIAVGSGGIKPCVSAHVGDQFGRGNKHLLSTVFGWFYFSINFGSFFSTLLTPWLLQWYGPAWAFGVPGVLMFFATIVFWMGRHKFVHVQPRGLDFVRQAFTGEGLGVIAKLIPVYLFIAVFWSLYDQTGSAWVLQAGKMDRTFLGVNWLESQIQAINPLLILAFIPIFTYLLYPLISKVFPLTPVRKISIGLFVTAGAFAISGTIESMIDQGLTPNIAWQLLAYVVITAAEVMVSITGLEFSYTQAPPQMKSFVMSLFLLTVSLGNVFTATVNRFIQIPEGTAEVTPAVESQLSAAAAVIELAWREHPENRLPDVVTGESRLAAADAAMAGLVYSLVDGETFQVSHPGEDGEAFTSDDVNLRVVAPTLPPSDEEIRAILDAPETWREQNVPGAARPTEAELRTTDDTFDRSIAIGGGTTLPGASYYWFFTWIMLGAAVLFMGVGRFYKPHDYIQGDDEFDGLDDAHKAAVAAGETDDR